MNSLFSYLYFWSADITGMQYMLVLFEVLWLFVSFVRDARRALNQGLAAC